MSYCSALAVLGLFVVVSTSAFSAEDPYDRYLKSAMMPASEALNTLSKIKNNPAIWEIYCKYRVHNANSVTLYDKGIQGPRYQEEIEIAKKQFGKLAKLGINMNKLDNSASYAKRHPDGALNTKLKEVYWQTLPDCGSQYSSILVR